MNNISVIIPYYKGHAYLSEVFSSLFQQAEKDDEIIIVSDNSMNLYRLAFLKKLGGKNFRIVHLGVEEEMGKHIGHRGQARNKGAEESKNDILLFCDEDIILEKGYIDFARNNISQDVILHGGVYDYKTKNVAVRLNSAYPFYEDKTSWFDRCPSNNLAMFKETFWKVGGFDEDYIGWGWEDVDFSLRANKLAIRYNYPQDLKCFHIKHPVSHRDNLSSSERNYRLFRRKHPEIDLSYPYSKMRMYEGEKK